MSTVIGDLIAEYAERPADGSEAPVLTLTERKGFVLQSERFHKRLATDDTSRYKVVRRHDIAFNPYLLWAGAVAQNIIVEEGIISPLYPTFRVRAGFDPRYVARLLLSPQIVASYDTIAFGSIPRRRRSSVTDFLALDLPWAPPNLDAQRRIAAILDQADALRVKRRQVLAQLDVLSQSIFDDMFGDPSGWPSRWRMGCIEDMAESVQYGTSGKAGETGTFPILRMGNITDDGRIDLSDLKYIDLHARDVTKYTVRRGDLLFNRTNSPEKVGKAAVVRTDVRLALAGYLVRVRVDPKHSPEFISAYLRSEHGKATRRGMAKVAINQANISAGAMKRISIALPPTDLQKKFERRLHEIEAFRGRIQEVLKREDVLFESLQSRGFRGEL